MGVPPANPPKGYITFADFAKLLGLNQKTISKYINSSPNDKYRGKYKIFLDANTESMMSGSYRYFKKPTANQLKKIKEFFSKTTISSDLINDIKSLHNSKVIQSSLKKGELPPLEVATEVTGKSVGRTANAMGTLGKMYRGTTFRDFELPADAKKGTLIFNKIKTGRSMTNPYKRAFYQIAIDEVDKSIGKEVGTFRKFKRFRSRTKENKRK